MEKVKILWVDDEIELLKPHVMFLQRKGYELATANNGEDALEMIDNQVFDIVFLDENMPGLSGLQVLQDMKAIDSSLPIALNVFFAKSKNVRAVPEPKL